MPDDNLFPNQTTEAETPAGKPGNGADPQGGAEPLTMAAAAELITQALAPMSDRLEELGRTNQQLAQNLQSYQPSTSPSKNQEAEEDFLTQFSANPEGAIASLVQRQMQTAVPLISGMMNSNVETFMGFEQAEVDKEFGSGAWKAHFDAPVRTILDSYRKSNAAALADRSTITREVDGLKGRLFNQLVDFREKSRKTTAESEEGGTKKLVDGVLERVVKQTNLTGGLRRISSGEEEITEDLKGYLAERTAAIGGDENPKDFLHRTDYGNTYEDFQRHQAKLAAAKGGN